MRTILRTILLLFSLLVTFVISMEGQPVCTIIHYDEDSGLSQWRISQMLQDESGFIWISTWNGLDRFDGYEFVNFKSRAGDDVVMPTERLRDMRMSKEGDIYVMADKQWFRFDRKTGKFSKADAAHIQYFSHATRGRMSFGAIDRPIDYRDRNGVNWHIDKDGRLSYQGADGILVDYPTEMPLKSNFYMNDRQDNLWLFGDQGIFCLSFALRPTKWIPEATRAQGSCIYFDKDGNYWLTTRKQASTVQLFNYRNQLLGYLDRTGHVRQAEVDFGSPIYCMRRLNDGTIWMGSKPDGLFRLRPNGERSWTVEQFKDLPCTDVYSIVEDHRGRLWIATMGGGLLVCEDKDAEKPHFIDVRTFASYPKTQESKVRYLHITNNHILLAATTEGLLVGRIPDGNVRTMSFHLHQREANRSSSLSCNATMDILETLDHRIFISTESGGINEVKGGEGLLASSLDFRHYNMTTGLNSDVALSLALNGPSLWIVGSNQLMRLNINDGTFEYLDCHFFRESYRFSECRPLHLDNGQWIFGVSDGFISLSDVAAKKSQYIPSIVLTGIDKQGQGIDRSVNHLETLILQPDERSLAIHFSAIDTDNPDGISYAYKMENEEEWNYIGHNRVATFAGLKPGTYRLQLRSTNADGVWVDNIRTLEIIVKPRFFEAWYGQMLIFFGLIALLGAAVYTYLYIRRIKKEQYETLQAYLELVGKADSSNKVSDTSNKEQEVSVSEDTSVVTHLSPDDEAFMSRVVGFVEEHLSDSDVNINDMADAAAVSRSGLNRKMKALVGLTPADFMREARIKRACQLLLSSDRSVAEIAYSCGFTDPKYFTKCFRSSIGTTPTEYRSRA